MPPTDIRPGPSREEIDPAALEIMRRHRDEVMASARRWADSPEDAEDAFQRGLEIMLTKAPSTDPEHLVPWLKTVVKREAWAIRRQRERHTPPASEFADLDSPGPSTAHDQAVCFERLQLGAEAMHQLKPQEIRAFVLKAEGLSYQEICEETGWTYTKVNRCLSEGRRRFHDRLAGIESGAECDRLAPQLSALADGEATAADMTLLRPHLRTCLVCRARLRDYRDAPAKVAAVTAPVAMGGSLIALARETLAGIAARWHQAAELAVAHKGVAVVASAAVLGGGGVATVATVGEPAPAQPAAGTIAPLEPPPTTPVTSPPPVADDDAASRDPHANAPRKTRPRPERERRAVPPPTGEFTPDSTPPIAPAPPPQRQPQPPGGGEFSP